MAKKDLTEIIVVLDRSNSMMTIRSAMEGAFDSFIKEQRSLPGECRVTLVQFDDIVETVYAGKDIADVPALALVPRGWTALLDALGMTITATGERLNALPDSDRPERVLFVVITDGDENRSSEFGGESGRQRVMDMVLHQTEKYSWQFVYFGANQDAIAVAANLGIMTAQNFTASPGGTRKALGNLNVSTRNYRSGGGYTGGIP